MIADNRLSELSEIDDAKLTAVLRELTAAGHDIELAGFTTEEFEKLTGVEDQVKSLEEIPKMQLQAFEHYDYLLFMFRDIRDWLRILQLLKVAKVDFSVSRKSQKIGIGRVIDGKTLLRKLENPPGDNVAGPSGAGDDVRPSPAGDARGA
jgi:hypothetical protein